ncbi:MAG: sugar ABC transporter permease [Treponema sp.]|nr:sugar ABC transporter permease [Treponema sp.]
MGMKIQPVGNAAKLQRWGYFFILPFIIVYAIFSLYPTFYTFFLAFTDAGGLRRTINIVGLENFTRLIHDTQFWGALRNTFILWGMNFIPQIGIAFLLSIWLSDARLNLKLRGPFRAIIYMPNLLAAASVALLFRSLFDWPQGPINQFLFPLGIHSWTERAGEIVPEAINFFRSVPLTRAIVAFIQFWMWYGHTVILLMAGITSISTTYFEAARIDGANSWQTTWRITLPLLRPIMLFVLVTSMIGGMQMFEIPFLLTGMRGEPDFSIRTNMVYMFNIGFQGVNDRAYAAAISVGVFFITMILALIIFFFLQDRSDISRKGAK